MVPMALNIKNERVVALARRAAEITNTSQTGAIELALTELLRQHGERADDAASRARFDLARGIAAEYVADPGHRDSLRPEDLYDAGTGLPR